jgi:hypothetical protein
MFHARNQSDIRRQIDEFVRRSGIKKWEALQTARTLKK